jgi:hypothetical protein
MTDHTNTPGRRCRHYPDRVLRRKDLASEMGGEFGDLCEKTIDNLVAAGKLPEPVWMNSMPVWMLHDVHDFISAAAGSRRTGAKSEPADASTSKNRKKTPGDSSAHKAGKYRV